MAVMWFSLLIGIMYKQLLNSQWLCVVSSVSTASQVCLSEGTVTAESVFTLIGVWFCSVSDEEVIFSFSCPQKLNVVLTFLDSLLFLRLE